MNRISYPRWKDWHSRPFGGMEDVLGRDGEFGNFVRALERHLKTVLVSGMCKFSKGGWKPSSTNDNSWSSKIYLCQFVARTIFGFGQDQARMKRTVAGCSTPGTPILPGATKWSRARRRAASTIHAVLPPGFGSARKAGAAIVDPGIPKEGEHGNDGHGNKVIVIPFDGAALDRDLTREMLPGHAN